MVFSRELYFVKVAQILILWNLFLWKWSMIKQWNHMIQPHSLGSKWLWGPQNPWKLYPWKNPLYNGVGRWYRKGALVKGCSKSDAIWASFMDSFVILGGSSPPPPHSYTSFITRGNWLFCCAIIIARVYRIDDADHYYMPIITSEINPNPHCIFGWLCSVAM